MQKIILIFTSLFILACSHQKNAYDENADAKAVVQQGLTAAKVASKPVFLIFGANWCADCQALSASLETGKKAKEIAAAFQVIKVNVGNFDKNLDITKVYGNPIQGGIPGAVILNRDNDIIYTFKPGQLAQIRQQGDDALYDFLTAHSS